MKAIVCTLLSGAAFYFSIGLGEVWPLAWIAATPLLWLAFGEARLAAAVCAAFAAYAIGGANFLPAYASIMPVPILVIAIVGPALLFALAVLGARWAYRAFGAAAGVIVFAALWTAADFALSFDPAGGSALTPAGAQAAAPILIQIASVVGYLGVTFALGAVSAALAAAARKRSVAFAAAAFVIVASIAGFGAWRMSAPPVEGMRVALIADDAAVGEIWRSDEAAARRIIEAYAQEVRTLRGDGVELIVLPENMARLDPAWRDDALAPLAHAAEDVGATIVAGFNTELDGAAYNVAWSHEPGGNVSFYAKRRLVQGLETPLYAIGDGPRVLSSGVMVVICKDLDFQAMIRADVAATTPRIIAAPAWDFRVDGWSHARIAILRGVENGVPLARSARDGLLTLSDAYGRVVARESSRAGMAAVIGEVRIAPGGTLYRWVGNAFGWLCLALGTAMALISALALRRRASSRPAASGSLPHP